MTTEQTAKFPSLPRDGLGLPDLQEWIAFYGGYDSIPNAAWTEWDRLGAPAPRDKDNDRASRKSRREKTTQSLYAALDRTGVALASTPYLITPWIRPGAI